MTTTGIYIIANLQNHKIYIGSSINIEKRWKEHIYLLSHGIHKNTHLQAAWTKYGQDSFELRVLTQCDKDSLLKYEQKAIDVYKGAIGWDMMYNMATLARSRLGIKCSDAIKAKLSAMRKGKSIKGHKINQATRHKISVAHQGSMVSQETRAKISSTLKGKKKSPEHVAKVAATKIGNQYAKGSRRSPEIRARMSESAKQAWRNRS